VELDFSVGAKVEFSCCFTPDRNPPDGRRGQKNQRASKTGDVRDGKCYRPNCHRSLARETKCEDSAIVDRKRGSTEGRFKNGQRGGANVPLKGL